MIYLDTNVILDILGEGSDWRDWSVRTVVENRVAHAIVTGPVVIGELAGRGAAFDAVMAQLRELGIESLAMEADAGHRAGVAYRDYRRSGGTREKLIADFLIGGHAFALRATLLTRDARPFRRYFPELALITPEDSHG